MLPGTLRVNVLSLHKYDSLSNLSLFTSLLDINEGYFLHNSYLLSTFYILGPEKTHSSDTLGIPSTLMKFAWIIIPTFYFLYFQFLPFKSVSMRLVSMSCPKHKLYHVDPFPKTQPAFFSSSAEFNFLFVDMTVKVFISHS